MTPSESTIDSDDGPPDPTQNPNEEREEHEANSNDDVDGRSNIESSSDRIGVGPTLTGTSAQLTIDE